MMQNKGLLIIFIILFQIVILAAMVFNSYAVLLWGEEIDLKVEPVDPRSLFQGDYVILSYPFSNLDLSEVKYDFNPEDINHHDNIYLAFARKNDTWEVVQATKDPKNIDEEIYIKGKVLYVMDNLPISSKPPTIHVKLGIEAYYVPEGKGKEIEEKINEGSIYARISVYKGRARVVELITR